MSGGPLIVGLEAAAYRIPTDGPESDGTAEWDATDVLVVHARAGGLTGLGYAYGHPAAAGVVPTLEEAVRGTDALGVPAAHAAMLRAVRNAGRAGVASTAISAVDTALWDLKGRLLDLSLADLLGRVREAVPAYGSGGFTSYTTGRLREQLGSWAAAGMRFVKMKIGRDPAADPVRVAAAREAVGPDVELFVDANGAFDRAGALATAARLAGLGVTWFEEPVSSDDLTGLAAVRAGAPAGMAIAAGEYGYDLPYFARMAGAGAVDCLQADATRCGGPSGFAGAAAVCAAHCLPLSAHTAPTVHAHLGCALAPVRHVEFFHDHARAEAILFDGALAPSDGLLRPDPERPGLGLELRRVDTRRYAL